jgi:hypothetical protein
MKVSANLRLRPRDHHNVGCALGDFVIAGRALIRLCCLEGLEHSHVEIGVGPPSDAGDQVRHVAIRIILIG